MKFTRMMEVGIVILSLVLTLAPDLARAADLSRATNPSPKTINVSIFPFVATLGTNAAAIERALAAQSAKVCGGLGQVERLDHVRLDVQESIVYRVNPTGIAGGDLQTAIFEFMYPKVTGSADVVCKTD